ncbi:MAG TPA: hypothetical protein PKK84_06525 [Armatimonadota bacterium]|nr:hypothetical protein [Armatimonadota bacterium]
MKTFLKRYWFALFALIALASTASARGPVADSDFATRVLAFNAANGVPNYTENPEFALGPPSADALPAVPDNTSLFSFGWTGYITLGFDRPIMNDTRNPGGFDFIVFGNTMYAGDDIDYPNFEPGFVEVGVDPAGNHEYGDGTQVLWYWLKGQPAPDTTDGFPMPMPAPGSILLGYADCTPVDGAGDPLVPDDPSVPGITNGTAGGDPFDIAWAVDQNGAPVELPYIDFVRISCAVNLNQGVLGYVSTEVDAVSIVRPRVPGDLDYDGFATLADVVLTARFVNGSMDLTDEEKARANVSGHEGDPTMADAVGILRIASGLASWK